jgi:DNA-binding NarL/FixJ family response regulator
MIKAALIDRQNLFAQGLIALFEKTNYPALKVTSHFTHAQDFLENEFRSVDLVFMDINLGDEDGMEFVPKIKNLPHALRLIILTSYGDYRYVKDAMQKGADGFILKNSDYSELANCIDEVMDGNTYIGEGLSITPPLNSFRKGFAVDKKMAYYEDRFQIKQKLTKREIEILKLIIQAKSNKEIGDELYISDQTVGVHRKNIMRKLGVRSTMTLIKFTIENQLV